MRWITRAHPRIDRIVCCWLIQRFIDDQAKFHFAAADQVLAEARRLGAVPFGVPGADSGALSAFDALRAKYRIDGGALDLLGAIVGAADTGRAELAMQSAGLLAILTGLAQRCASDAELLQQGGIVYDALYGWCRKAPPGLDFALSRREPRAATSWGRSLRARQGQLRAARALAALNDATLRERALERACGGWGPAELADVKAAAVRAATAPQAVSRWREAANAAVALLARASTFIGRARRRRCLDRLDHALPHGAAVRLDRPAPWG
jgi:hypothetical protein